MDSAKPVLVFDTTAIPRYMLVEKTGAFLFAPELSAIYRGERWVERLHRSCERDAGDCRRIAQSFANYIRHSVEYFDAQGIR